VDIRATENPQALTLGKQIAHLLERNVQNITRKDIMQGVARRRVTRKMRLQTTQRRRLQEHTTSQSTGWQDLQSITVDTELDEEAAKYEEVLP
jgi:hypothetical protein